MGVAYPEYPTSVGGVRDFRDQFGDPAVDVWVQVGGEPERFRLLENGVIRETSKFGTSFEGRMGPAGPPGAYVLFHLCRHAHCGYRGSSNSANGKASGGKMSDVLHVSRIAYIGLAISLSPRMWSPRPPRRWFRRLRGYQIPPSNSMVTRGTAGRAVLFPRHVSHGRFLNAVNLLALFPHNSKTLDGCCSC